MIDTAKIYQEMFEQYPLDFKDKEEDIYHVYPKRILFLLEQIKKAYDKGYEDGYKERKFFR